MPISLASSTSTMSNNNTPIAANFNKNGPTLVEYSSSGGGGGGNANGGGLTPTFITTSSSDHSSLFSSPTYLINSKLVNTNAPTASFIQIVNTNNKIESAQPAHQHHHHHQQQQQTSLIAPNKLYLNNNGTGATFNSNGVVTNDSNSTNRPVLFVLLTPNDLNNLTKQSEAQQQPAIYDTNNNIINQKAGQILVTSNNQASSVNDNIDSAIDAVLAKFRCDDSLEDESSKKSKKGGASLQQTVKLEKNSPAANNNNNSSSLTVAAHNEQAAGLNKASVSSNKARTSYISSLIANREQKRAEGGGDELNQSEQSNTGTTVTTTSNNNSVAKKPASQNILTILASNGTGCQQQISSNTESTNNHITTSPKVNINSNNNGFQSIKPKKSTTSSIQKVNTSDMTNSISYLECNNLKRILSEPVANSVEKSNDSTNGVISVTMTQALMESSFGQNVLIKVEPLQENKKTPVKRGAGGRKKQQATVNDGPKRKNARQPRKSSTTAASIPAARHAVDMSQLEINSLPNSLVITTASTNGRVLQHDQSLAQSKPKKLKTVADLVKQNNQQKQQQQMLATTAKSSSSSSNLIPSIEFNDNRVLTNSTSNNSTLCLSNDQSSSHDHHMGVNCWINGSNNHDKNNNGLLNNEHSGFVRLVENDLVSSSKLSITSITNSSTLSIPLSSSPTSANNNTHHLDSSMHHHISHHHHHQIQPTSSTPANNSSNTTTLTINDIDNLLELELQPVVDSSSGSDKYLDLDDIDVNPLVDCYNSTHSSSTMNHHHNNNNNNHSRNLTHLTSTTSNNKSVGGNHLDEFNFQISVCSSASSSSSSSSSGFSEPSTCSNLSTCSSQSSNTSTNGNGGMLPGFKLTNNSSASSSSSSSPSWNTNQLEFNCYENKQNGNMFLQNLVDSSSSHHHHMMSNNCNQQNLYASSMDLGYSNSMIESSLFGNGTGFNFFNDEIKLEIQ